MPLCHQGVQCRHGGDCRPPDIFIFCAPVYSAYHGLSTEVPAGIDNGLKHDCSIHCDELVSIPKSMLSNFIGTLSPAQMNKLDQALSIALGLDKFPA